MITKNSAYLWLHIENEKNKIKTWQKSLSYQPACGWKLLECDCDCDCDCGGGEQQATGFARAEKIDFRRASRRRRPRRAYKPPRRMNLYRQTVSPRNSCPAG